MKHKKHYPRDSRKKHYPDKEVVRQQGSCIEAAMMALAGFGIEVMTIDFTGSIPVIEVFHSSGTGQVRQEDKGRGHNGQGRYIRKVAHVQGCLVEWNEVVG